jgi:DNA-binding transcriptional MerR regulator
MGLIDISKLVGTGLEETFEAFEAVMERFIKSSKVGVTPRVLSYYKTHDLLFKNIIFEKHDHILFSFTDFVWFQMIKKMRTYDIGLSIIKEIKEFLETPFPFAEFIQEAKNSEKFINKLPENIREEALEVFHGDIDWDEIHQQYNLNYLSLLLAETIVKRKHVAIMINSEGDLFPFSFEDFNELNKDEPFQNFLQSTFLSISLSQIIKEFIPAFDVNISYKLSILSKREAQVIGILHENEIESLTVYLDDNKSIKLIEVQEKYNKIDKEARLLDLVLKDGYQTIELKTQNGKIVHCKNLRKIKPTEETGTVTNRPIE